MVYSQGPCSIHNDIHSGVAQSVERPAVDVSDTIKAVSDKRTYADRAEYLRKAVTRRRKELRRKAREYKGGKCMLCGYDRCPDALEFHHTDPTKKDFGLSVKGLTRSWEKIRTEIDKCVLVCANCHREIHAGIQQLLEVTRVETQGELLETLTPPISGTGNQQPSPKRKRGKGSETIPSGSSSET